MHAKPLASICLEVSSLYILAIVVEVLPPPSTSPSNHHHHHQCISTSIDCKLLDVRSFSSLCLAFNKCLINGCRIELLKQLFNLQFIVLALVIKCYEIICYVLVTQLGGFVFVFFWLEMTGIYFLTFPEATSLKSRCLQVNLALEVLGEVSSLLQRLVVLGIPWLVVASLWSPPPSSCGLSPVLHHFCLSLLSL